MSSRRANKLFAYAAACDFEGLANLLLRCPRINVNAEANRRDAAHLGARRTPLHYALCAKHPQKAAVVELLLRAGASVSTAHLLVAVRKDDAVVLQHLLRYSATNHECVCLRSAQSAGVIRALVAHGAKATVYTLLNAIDNNRGIEVVRALIDCGAPVHWNCLSVSPPVWPLARAAARGHWQYFPTLLEANANILIGQVHNNVVISTPLQAAAAHNQPYAMHALLALGAPPKLDKLHLYPAASVEAIGKAHNNAILSCLRARGPYMFAAWALQQGRVIAPTAPAVAAECLRLADGDQNAELLASMALKGWHYKRHHYYLRGTRCAIRTAMLLLQRALLPNELCHFILQFAF